jgi:hypothetical protein
MHTRTSLLVVIQSRYHDIIDAHNAAHNIRSKDGTIIESDSSSSSSSSSSDSSESSSDDSSSNDSSSSSDSSSDDDDDDDDNDNDNDQSEINQSKRRRNNDHITSNSISTITKMVSGVKDSKHIAPSLTSRVVMEIKKQVDHDDDNKHNVNDTREDESKEMKDDQIHHNAKEVSTRPPLVVDISSTTLSTSHAMNTSGDETNDIIHVATDHKTNDDRIISHPITVRTDRSSSSPPPSSSPSAIVEEQPFTQAGESSLPLPSTQLQSLSSSSQSLQSQPSIITTASLEEPASATVTLMTQTVPQSQSLSIVDAKTAIPIDEVSPPSLSISSSDANNGMS